MTYPHPSLRGPAHQVEPDDLGACSPLVEHMLECLVGTHGVGLAAPQVAVPARLFITLATGKLRVFINPEILSLGKRTHLAPEGCMSVPGFFAPLVRPFTVKVRYQGLSGEYHTEQFSGLLARAVQHEYDHLEGRMFLDRLTPRERKRAPKDVLAAWNEENCHAQVG